MEHKEDSALIKKISFQISDDRVIDAIRLVPRSNFLPKEHQRLSQEDTALPIGHGQTTSQPSLIGIMLRELDIRIEDTVMEVGSGSGYVCAILSNLCYKVIGVERIQQLLSFSRCNLHRLGIKNVHLRLAEQKVRPRTNELFSKIIVSAALPKIPSGILENLDLNGTLICPVGSLDLQRLVKIEKTVRGNQITTGLSCRFVPLIGKSGWAVRDLQ